MDDKGTTPRKGCKKLEYDSKLPISTGKSGGFSLWKNLWKLCITFHTGWKLWRYVNEMNVAYPQILQLSVENTVLRYQKDYVILNLEVLFCVLRAARAVDRLRG